MRGISLKENVQNAVAVVTGTLCMVPKTVKNTALAAGEVAIAGTVGIMTTAATTAAYDGAVAGVCRGLLVNKVEKLEARKGAFGTTKYFDPATGKRVKTVELHLSPVAANAITAGRIVVAGTSGAAAASYVHNKMRDNRLMHQKSVSYTGMDIEDVFAEDLEETEA